MTLSHQICTDHARRLGGGTATGLAAAAGALLAVAVGQLAIAPVARADDFSDIVEEVQIVIHTGQTELANAAGDYSNFDLADGLSESTAGWDNLLLAPQEDVSVGTIDALLGHAPAIFGFDTIPAGLDLATAITDAQGMAAEGQSIFADAVTHFGNADFIAALELAVNAYNDIFVTAPDFLSIGLTDALLGL
jgi:hypothetical protein